MPTLNANKISKTIEILKPSTTVAVSKITAVAEKAVPQLKLSKTANLTQSTLLLNHCFQLDSFVRESSGATGFCKKHMKSGKNYCEDWASYEKSFKELRESLENSNNSNFKMDKTLKGKIKKYCDDFSKLVKGHDTLRQKWKEEQISIMSFIAGKVAGTGASFISIPLPPPANFVFGFAVDNATKQGFSSFLSHFMHSKQKSLKEHVFCGIRSLISKIVNSGCKKLPYGFIYSPVVSSMAAGVTDKALYWGKKDLNIPQKVCKKVVINLPFRYAKRYIKHYIKHYAKQD